VSDYEPDRHAEDEDRRLLEEYDACPENFRPVIETPITDAMRLRWWHESCLEAATVDKILDSHADLERETVLLRRQRDRLAEAARKIKANSSAIQKIRYGYDGDFGAIRLAEFIEEDCDRALALLKQLP